MTFEDKLKCYKETEKLSERKDAILKTVNLSKETFYASEQNKVLPYYEFLFTQFKLIEKKWWILQILLLVMFWKIFPFLVKTETTQRSMGVVATLFILLVIPELWKNRSARSMEIEAASYYSLRQIYSARMLFFGIVDVLLITIFCQIATVTLKLAMSQLLVQLVFPMVITACICFGVLCSKQYSNEVVAMGMCVIWSFLWYLLISNETIYAWITFPIWMVMLGIAFVFLGFMIYRTLSSCNQYWEVNLNGIEG